jgi:hypothetical protein
MGNRAGTSEYSHQTRSVIRSVVSSRDGKARDFRGLRRLPHNSGGGGGGAD